MHRKIVTVEAALEKLSHQLWGSEMPGISNQTQLDAERAEFEAVLETFSRTPRLAKLLSFIGERYFRGESDQLTEYNIATEALGRSKQVFDASRDAIARVEAHRLRNRLKDFYQGPGKDHPLRMSIPAGTYVPVFTRKTIEFAPYDEPILTGIPKGKKQILPDPAQVSTGVDKDHSGRAVSAVAPQRSQLAKYLLFGLGLACLAAAAFYADRRFHSKPSVPAASGDLAQYARSSTGALLAPAPMPLRMLAGYSGKPQTDTAGAVWGPDQYVHGGGPWLRPEAFVARTSDPLIYQQWRTGDFTYDIPIRPGVYELHLYFVASDSSADSLATFEVRINGTTVLSGFDVNIDALGANVADERVFRDISPASDGMLHLNFKSERGAPMLNAIEILPGIPHKTLPIRIVTQQTSVTDHDGQFWHPDTYCMNGQLADKPQQTIGSPDPGLFATERFGHFTYAIPVDTRDRYTLILHFVEFYYGPQAPGGGGVGNRLFRVMCNGETLLDNFDIFKEAGSLHVLTKTFYHIRPSAQGKLNLTFEPIANNATVSGIEVLDESQ